MARMNVQRRITRCACVFDDGAQALQGFDQVADRTFVHAGDAVQVIVAASQCQCGGQRPECGTGIAEEKVGLPDRPAAVTAFDAESPAVCLLRQADAQLLQGLQHAVGIVGLKHAMNQGLAGGEGG